MVRADINHFLEKHCRFRLRSGKEVYGILWRDSNEGNLFFSSASERIKPHKLRDTALSLNADDIIFAEQLQDQMAS